MAREMRFLNGETQKKKGGGGGGFFGEEKKKKKNVFFLMASNGGPTRARKHAELAARMSVTATQSPSSSDLLIADRSRKLGIPVIAGHRAVVDAATRLEKHTGETPPRQSNGPTARSQRHEESRHVFVGRRREARLFDRRQLPIRHCASAACAG